MKIIKFLCAILIFSPCIAMSMTMEDVLYKACSDGATKYSAVGLSFANRLRTLSALNLGTDEFDRRKEIMKEELFAYKNQKFRELHTKRDELSRLLGSQTNVEFYILISTNAVFTSFIQSMQTGENDDLKLFVKVNSVCLEEFKRFAN